MKKLILVLLAMGQVAFADAKKPLVLGLGPLLPSHQETEAGFRSFADYLAARLNRPVQMLVVNSWDELATAMIEGKADMALMGPWSYVMANNKVGSLVIATLLQDKQPIYHAIMVAGANTGIMSPEDLRGKTFAFGDKGSFSAYLEPLYYLKATLGINQPEDFFSSVTYGSSGSNIEKAVAAGQVDAGPDWDGSRQGMIERGLLDPKASRVIWTSPALPNDAFAISKELQEDPALVSDLRQALLASSDQPHLLMPPHFDGYVEKDDSFYQPIRDVAQYLGKLNSADFTMAPQGFYGDDGGYCEHLYYSDRAAWEQRCNRPKRPVRTCGYGPRHRKCI